MKEQHSESQSSVQQVLQLIRNLKAQKSKQLSSLDFSQKSSQWRSPLRSRHDQCNTHTQTVFDKLYRQSKEKQQRKYLIQYESRRSKQEKDRAQCTFSPNVSRRMKTQNYQEASTNDDSFYLKNIEWLERKQKSIKVKQCQKNQENYHQLTFTPRINKFKKQKPGNDSNDKKGVLGFLQRQNKAKNMQKFIEQRKKNPYSHIWTVKKGAFSNPYLR